MLVWRSPHCAICILTVGTANPNPRQNTVISAHSHWYAVSRCELYTRTERRPVPAEPPVFVPCVPSFTILGNNYIAQNIANFVLTVWMSHSSRKLFIHTHLSKCLMGMTRVCVPYRRSCTLLTCHAGWFLLF